MKTQHTPGPWTVSGLCIVSRLVANYAHEYQTQVATISAKRASEDGSELVIMCDDEKDSNARLIAAAPDMLAALAKIETDLTALLCERVLDSTLPEFYTVRDARNAARAAIAKATGQA